MRRLLVVGVVASCGGDDGAAIDVSCKPTVVYLNRGGGMFDRGPHDDAINDLSVVVDGPRVLEAWPNDDWSEIVTCMRDGLALFPRLAVTDVDPGTGAAPRDRVHDELLGRCGSRRWWHRRAAGSGISSSSCSAMRSRRHADLSRRPARVRADDGAAIAERELQRLPEQRTGLRAGTHVHRRDSCVRRCVEPAGGVSVRWDDREYVSGDRDDVPGVPVVVYRAQAMHKPTPESQRVFAPGIFKDQVAIVTGGGSGIGLATAIELVRLGARVAICGRTQAKLDAARRELAEARRRRRVRRAAVRHPRARAGRGVRQGRRSRRWGRIDILVNNAGGQFPSPAQHISPNGFLAVVKNNLVGTFHMCREVANQWMIPHKGGRIINVIANIYRGFPGMVHTGAARAGVENMTMTLAVEWAQFGILVNAVAPGIILSSGTAQYPPQILERGIAETPLKRAGTVDEVAASIVFLASPAAQFITGATLRIDGGAGAVGPHLGDPVMDLGLAGKACLVSGASRGIGRAIALALAREGARVAAVARGAADLAALDARARRRRATHAIVADVATADGASAAVDGTRRARSAGSTS